MHLAKPALDVGLYTVHLDPMLAFWQLEVGVPFDHLLPAGRGVHQHRHRIGDSVLKINHVRDPLAAVAPSGYRRLTIARDGVGEPRELVDPDGNAVRLVPPGWQGITQLEVEIAVRDLAAARAFYADALGLDRIPGSDHRFRCGASLLALREDATATLDPPLRAPGYRYTTIQVFDVLSEHAGCLQRGGREGTAPVRLGDVAFISFVRDPDGNWIEISQRKSLTGSAGALADSA
jgi:catechol 2,3-dioxygenase-like lactoylglutathione lyase family enzyme